MSDTHPVTNGDGFEPAVTTRRYRKRRSATPLDVEAKAIGDVYVALKPLENDHAAMERVIEYVRQRYGFPS